MTVTELLKGKKAYEKDELLDDENLDTTIIDALSNDTARAVRVKAIFHKNITQEALMKSAFSKKNIDDKYILRIIYRRLNSNHKFECLKNKSWKLYSDAILLEIDNDFWMGIQKSNHKDDLINLFKTEFMSGDHSKFIMNYLLKYTDLNIDTKLYDYFLKKFPGKLAMYSPYQRFSQNQIDTLIDLYIDTIAGRYGVDIKNDLGSGILEKLTKNQISIILDNIKPLNQTDAIKALKYNSNLTSVHTEKIFKDITDWNEYSIIPFLIEAYPLNNVIEDKLYDWFEKYFSNNKVLWKLLESLAKNPTHNKSRLLKLIVDWDTDNGWSINIINAMLDTGMYNENDIQKIFASKNEYYKNDINKYLIKNKNFPKTELERLWKENWSKWKNKKVEDPTKGNTFSGPDFKRFNIIEEEAQINMILYNLLKYSSLSTEFASEYFSATQDASYLPELAKDIFLF